MTTVSGASLSTADIYTASKPALDAALVAYETAVKAIVKPVAGEHYVSGRVKAKRSLIRKLAKDGNGSLRSWEQITDKVGVRVICSTKRDRKAAAAALEQYGWAECRREDKRAKKQGLAYTGVHVTVHDGTQLDSERLPILCEVQVRTRAQDAWSVVSHKLTYKGLIDLPNKLQRVVWRLTVLTEIFDDDIQRMFKKRESLPAYEVARAIEYLDDKYETLLGEPGGVPDDLDIMNILWNAYTAEERARFSEIIASFIDESPDLSKQIANHQPGKLGYVDSRDWLFTQPEVLAVLERGTRNEHMLVHAVSNTDLADVVTKTCAAYGVVLPG
ncbi:RelA/SpoT domain-containing protein [Herbiconiux sp. CPCC 205716]|uniref:RelA/SpoT domain-containing protein n=1 Tax=Herbiconiux gentiana TaxID=2970912 RepID=A0ABT2GGF7_9MICO|nr:RelA/SpoT domain-containing protein [Herbiconiux gentiana]MCS5714692.1 RelA/SpoT domain-containing protein [Herbiconiux gentiana]